MLCGIKCFDILLLSIVPPKEIPECKQNETTTIVLFYLYTTYLLIPMLLLHQSDLSISLEDPLLFRMAIYTIHVNQTLSRYHTT